MNFDRFFLNEVQNVFQIGSETDSGMAHNGSDLLRMNFNLNESEPIRTNPSSDWSKPNFHLEPIRMNPTSEIFWFIRMKKLCLDWSGFIRIGSNWKFGFDQSELGLVLDWFGFEAWFGFIRIEIHFEQIRSIMSHSGICFRTNWKNILYLVALFRMNPRSEWFWFIRMKKLGFD